MAKLIILLAAIFVSGFSNPVPQDDVPHFDEDMAIFFDHTVADAEGRIVGGSVAPVGAFPWMTALTTGVGTTFFCGGSILTRRFVLTAAHCIRAVASGSMIVGSFRMRVGSNTWGSGGTLVTADRNIVHSDYCPFTIKNDIGFFRISSNLDLNAPNVRAITPSYDNIPGNVPCRVSGWGRVVAGGAISAQLLQLQTNTMDGNTCVREMARVAAQLNVRTLPVEPAVELCAFVAVNRGTCNGDSGSALVLNSNNHQIGVVSWGLPCARGAPDVYVRVSAYRTWIQRTIR